MKVTFLKGKLVQFQRGPATVIGSLLQPATVHTLYGKAQKVMTMSQETCHILKTLTNLRGWGGVSRIFEYYVQEAIRTFQRHLHVQVKMFF